MNGFSQLESRLRQGAAWSLVVGLLGAVGCAFGAYFEPQEFFPAYLVAYLFWLGLALGAWAVAMIHNLTGGAWGLVIRRLLESASGTLALGGLLFLTVG